MSELEIKIPEEFSNILKDTEWNAIVEQVIINVQPFLSMSPKFFEEYTSHGIKHVNHVIENIKRLIPKGAIESKEALNAADIGMLLCAVIIHDLAMFIDDSQIYKFINDENQVVDGINSEKTNLELWKEYCNNAVCFSTEKWKGLLGELNGRIPKPV